MHDGLGVPGRMPVLYTMDRRRRSSTPTPKCTQAGAVEGIGRTGLPERAPSLEQPARALDVARDERPDRLVDVWCGQADALGAIVAIRTVAALSRTLNGAIFRKIAQSALSRTLPHPTGMAF